MLLGLAFLSLLRQRRWFRRHTRAVQNGRTRPHDVVFNNYAGSGEVCEVAGFVTLGHKRSVGRQVCGHRLYFTVATSITSMDKDITHR